CTTLFRSGADDAGPGASAELPALVGTAVAGPQDHRGAVGGGGALHVQAQARLEAGDGAVGVEFPALVGAAVAFPQDRRGAVAHAVVLGVKAPARAAGVDAQLSRRGVRPPLALAAVACPDLPPRSPCGRP